MKMMMLLDGWDSGDGSWEGQGGTCCTIPEFCRIKNHANFRKDSDWKDHHP